MTHRTRRFISAVLGSAVLLAGAARPTMVGAVSNARPTVVTLQSPCKLAGEDINRAARALNDASSKAANDAAPDAVNDAPAQANARAALDQIRRGFGDNGRCPDPGAQAYLMRTGAIDKRGAEALQRQHVADDGVLLSLQGQAQMLYSLYKWPKPTPFADDAWVRSLATADQRLAQCAKYNPDCRQQLRFNAETRRGGPLAASDPCVVAERDADLAGTTLKLEDINHARTADQAIADGLSQNKNCANRPQMKFVNDAFLSTWRVIADRRLNIKPLNPDADPFAAANAELQDCATGRNVPLDLQRRPLSSDVTSKCKVQLKSNQDAKAAFDSHAQYSRASVSCPNGNVGNVAAGPFGTALRCTTLNLPYTVIRNDFVWDTRAQPTDRPLPFAEELSIDKTSGLWVATPMRQMMRTQDNKDWVLFAAVRGMDDARKIFTSDTAAALSNFPFRDKMLLVAEQSQARQQCGLTITSLTGSIARRRDPIQAVYSLSCARPDATTIQPLTPAVLILAVDRTDGEVGFNEDRLPLASVPGTPR